VSRIRTRRLTTIAAAGVLAVAAPAAQAAAPGWSTPHTASAVTTGTYAAAPNGQGVQLFANGGVPQRIRGEPVRLGGRDLETDTRSRGQRRGQAVEPIRGITRSHGTLTRSA